MDAHFLLHGKKWAKEACQGVPPWYPNLQLRAFKARRGNIVCKNITPSVKYDDLRAVCFKFRVSFICSDINSFCNIHIGSKTKKNKGFGTIKNEKLNNNLPQILP